MGMAAGAAFIAATEGWSGPTASRHLSKSTSMYKSAIFLSGLTVVSLLGGCVGSGPNTEQGAITGGALGAVAGAVIGHNSRGGDAFGGALVGAATGALAGGLIGNNVDQERGTLYGAPDRRAYGRPDGREYRVVRAQTAPTPPPAPHETMPAPPAPNAVWVPGFWIYDGRTYTWMSGRWELPPPLARAYVPAHSEVRNGQVVYVPGYWQ
jgi:hypothetical protein